MQMSVSICSSRHEFTCGIVVNLIEEMKLMQLWRLQFTAIAEISWVIRVSPLTDSGFLAREFFVVVRLGGSSSASVSFAVSGSHRGVHLFRRFRNVFVVPRMAFNPNAESQKGGRYDDYRDCC
jgi:hypothetical protein